MSPDGSKLLEQALALPQTDRARLAVSLIDSLDEESRGFIPERPPGREDPRFDEDLESAWRAEVAHRIQQLDEDSVKTVDWMEVRRMLGA